MGSSVELFRSVKDNCNIFIETGTLNGDGVRCALDAGYKKIFTCDISEELVKKAKDRFMYENVIIECDKSSLALPIFLEEITEKCVIFLDGHSMPYNMDDVTLGFGENTVSDRSKPCPLLDELDIILSYPIKNHTIIIDDYKCFGTWIFGGILFTEVVNKIQSANKNYTYSIDNDRVIFTA